MMSDDPTLRIIEKNILKERREWLDAGSDSARDHHRRNVDRLLDRWLTVKRSIPA